MESGKLEAIWIKRMRRGPMDIDSRYKVADLGAAIQRQADRRRVGRVVVEVAEGWPL